MRDANKSVHSSSKALLEGFNEEKITSHKSLQRKRQYPYELERKSKCNQKKIWATRNVDFHDEQRKKLHLYDRL